MNNTLELNNDTAVDTRQVFTFTNVKTVVEVNYDMVKIVADSQEEAEALLAETLKNNEWSAATDPIRGEINIIEFEGVSEEELDDLPDDTDELDLEDAD